MAVSLRLDEETERLLREQAARRDVAVSDYLREALREKIERERARDDAYTLGAELFGRYASPHSDLAENAESYLREGLAEKTRNQGQDPI